MKNHLQLISTGNHSLIFIRSDTTIARHTRIVFVINILVNKVKHQKILFAVINFYGPNTFLFIWVISLFFFVVKFIQNHNIDKVSKN